MDNAPLSSAPTSKPSVSQKRRFRYGLRSLLFVVTVFVAALSWWVTWPQRAATRFVKLMVTAPDKAKETSSLSGGGMARVLTKYEHDAPYLEPHSRSLADMLQGKQTFTVVVPVSEPKLNGRDMEFTATLFFERGNFKGPIELDSRYQTPRE